jgi:uncharacterized membrane protein YraQ (UPF0718 family)
MVSILSTIAAATWEVYLLASPFILLGLATAGLVHVLIPSDRIARWLGKPGLGSTAKAALIGIPLPLCSCAVIPVTIELSRKGASREASLAFMVSTPETGVDSILLTYGLMGPVMAVARPVAALFTSFVASLASLAWPQPDETPEPAPDLTGEDTCCDPEPAEPSSESRLTRALRYGFVEMVDEIGFWLVAGLVVTGVITALVPEETVQTVVGTGPRALVTLLILGIPLYMCASASTPIAAALLLKGVSPGAAIVFLLAGPATNASALVLIARFFGRRFLVLFLVSVAASTLAFGWLFDYLLSHTSLTVVPKLVEPEAHLVDWIAIASAVALGVLLVAGILRGAWTNSLRELRRDLGSWRQLLNR